MSNWKKQHETARQALVTCLNELAGKGVVWITCDSTALVVDTIAWLEQHYLPGEHTVGYFALGDDYPMVTDIEGCSSSAVRRARCSGLLTRFQASAGAGRRQLRAALSPSGLRRVSVRPCSRPSPFHAVGA